MADEIEVGVDVETGRSVENLEAIRDTSKEAGEAVDELAGKDVDVAVDVQVDQGDAVPELEEVAAAADNVTNTPATVTVDIGDGVLAAAEGLEDVAAAAESAGGAGSIASGDLRKMAGPLGDTAREGVKAGRALQGLAGFAQSAAQKLGATPAAASKVSGAMLGIGVAIGAGVAAWKLYGEAEREAEQRGRKLKEIQEKLADGKTADAARDLVEAYGPLIEQAKLFGLSAEDVVRHLSGQGDALGKLKANLEGGILPEGEADEVNLVLDQMIERLGEGQEQWKENGAAIAAAGQEVEAVEGVLKTMSGEAGDAADAVGDLVDELKDMGDEIDVERDILDIADAFDEVHDAAVEAFTAAGNKSEDADAKARDYRRSQLDLKDAVLEYATSVKNLPAEKVTRILADIDEGKFGDAQRRFAELTAEKNVKLTADTTAVEDAIDRMVRNGVVIKPSTPSPTPSRRVQSEGGTTINYFAPPPDPHQVVWAQREYDRVNGTGG